MKNVICCFALMGAVVSEAAVTRLYTSFGVRPDGVWTNGNCRLKLGKDSFYQSGYVYTNSIGVVHQFSLEHRFPQTVDEVSAIDQLKSQELNLAKSYALSPFKKHVDSNPKRHLWSEECSMLGCGDWSVRLYLDRDEKKGGLVAKTSIWSPMLEGAKSTVVIQIGERVAGKPLKVNYDGDAYALPELEKKLASLARKDKKTLIAICISAMSSHNDLVSVLDVCYRHGLFNITMFTM